MIAYNQAERLTLKQVMEHPWVKSNDLPTQP